MCTIMSCELVVGLSCLVIAIVSFSASYFTWGEAFLTEHPTKGWYRKLSQVCFIFMTICSLFFFILGVVFLCI